MKSMATSYSTVINQSMIENFNQSMLRSI